MEKNEIRSLPIMVHKLKIDQRPKAKARYYKTLRGKPRQNTLWHKSKQDLSDLPPRVMKIKIKTK